MYSISITNTWCLTPTLAVFQLQVYHGVSIIKKNVPLINIQRKHDVNLSK